MTAYHAKRLPCHLGPAAWSAILPDQPPATPLTSDTTADFVIIGAGFAGLSAARRLKQLQPGARIMVLDAGRIAEGAAGRNSGFMIDLPHDLQSDDYSGAGDDRAVTALNRQAIGFARQAVQDYGIDRAFFDPVGKINGAASAQADGHNATYARHLTALGEAHERLDAQAMHAITGSRHYCSGLFTPGAVTLQPAGYVRGLAQGLARAGVMIHEGSAVAGFQRAGPDWSVQTAQARITTPRVILANNGHLESFGFESGRLMHLFLYAVMTPDLDADQRAALGGLPRWGITPSDPMGTTVRRIDTAQGGNRIITRTCASLRPGMAPSDAGLARARRIMQRKFDARFPALAGMRMEYAWAGPLCLSLNGVSVMKPLDDGVFAACVQNGLGTARGTLTGIGAAELACGVSSDITRHFGTQAPPRKLPPQPVQTLGANAVIRFREWRAREE